MVHFFFTPAITLIVHLFLHHITSLLIFTHRCLLFLLSSRFHFVSRFCLSRPKPNRKACLFSNPIIFNCFQSPFLSNTLPDWLLFNTYHRYDMQFLNFIFSSLFCICNSFFHPFFFVLNSPFLLFCVLFYTPLLTSI